jgi:hypothetical protein
VRGRKQHFRQQLRDMRVREAWVLGGTRGARRDQSPAAVSLCVSFGGNNQRVRVGKNCLHVYYRGAFKPCSAFLSSPFSRRGRRTHGDLPVSGGAGASESGGAPAHTNPLPHSLPPSVARRG